MVRKANFDSDDSTVDPASPAVDPINSDPDSNPDPDPTVDPVEPAADDAQAVDEPVENLPAVNAEEPFQADGEIDKTIGDDTEIAYTDENGERQQIPRTEYQEKGLG